MPERTTIPGSTFPAIARTMVGLFLLVALSASAAEKAEKGWILKQRSKLVGELTVYVSSDGLKMVNLDNHYVILARAPDWNVSFYNYASKAIWQVNADQFSGKLDAGNGVISGPYLTNLPVAPNGNKHEVIAGVTTEHESAIRHEKVARKRPSQYTSLYVETPILQADYYIWHECPVPERAAHIVQRLYRIPKRAGLPVRLNFRDADGDNIVELDTVTCKEAVLPPATFAVPRGYKVVATEMEVMNDAQRKDRAHRMIRAFDEWREVWKH